MRSKVDILISNGLIVTMNPRRDVVERGYVAISGDKIVDVGIGDGLDKHQAEIKLDARKSIVIPGLQCAHTHFYGLLLTGSPWFSKIEPPTDFQQNLQRIWWALDVLLGHDEAYASALIGSILFARSGVTNFFDNISSPCNIREILDYVERGVNEVGLRGFISFEATQRRSDQEGFEGLRENERFILKNNYDESKLVKGAVYVHASFTVKDELLLKAKELSKKHKALIAIHTEEGFVDVYHNIERYGVRPIERMKKVGFLDEYTHLVHVVHATDEELDIIRTSGAHVAHNPLSNMLNAVGVARVPEMVSLGINVGIGNDGYVFDQFENMRATYLLHKLLKRDPRILNPVQVFEMSTINVARMFHQSEYLGSIEPGKLADITITKPRAPNTPINSLTVYAHLINMINSRDVDTVIVNGKPILENNKLVNIDEEKAIEYVHKVVERLWDNLVSKGTYQHDYVR